MQLSLDYESTPASAVTTADAKRFSRQCAAILARLEHGPASNVELAAISIKYTGRISDLRKRGVRILCDRGEGGVNWYRIEPSSGT